MRINHTPEDFITIAEKIDSLVQRYATGGVLSLIRKMLRKEHGVEMNPVGIENRKTKVPSTYRPVGGTCPTTCQFLKNKSCYAMFGMVGVHEKRASNNLLPAITANCSAISVAIKNETIARLKVSGGWFKDGKLDKDYIFATAQVAKWFADKYNLKRVAYSYTHADPDEFEPYRILLSACGVEVLYSDQMQHGGTIVYPFEELRELRLARPDTTFVKCRNQLDKTTCKDCKLCFNAHNDGFTIVFKPHGTGTRKAKESSFCKIQGELHG